jgi:hypothetical protein
MSALDPRQRLTDLQRDDASRSALVSALMAVDRDASSRSTLVSA